MTEIVYQAMLPKYKKQTPVKETIKKWIKTIKPDYADKKGRETKQNKELLLELYNITIN